jgi:hemoglobin
VLVPAGHDLEYPETPFPPATLLATVGEKGLRTLVRDHHTRLREDAEIGHLFARDDTIFLERVEKIADFVVESCGGPTAYSEAEGPDVCMRTRHFPFEIDERAREIWLEKLFGALAASDFPTDCRRAYWKWMEAFSVRMINRRRTKAQPLRFSYDEAVGRWAQASVHQPSRHATAT